MASTAARIGAEGREVMAALDTGRALRRRGEDWRDAKLIVPAGLVAELKRHDLVREAGDRLALTAAGIGWSARQARPEAANRRLAERAVPADGEPRRRTTTRARARSVTTNLGESPLGWLMARGLVSARQFDAGERLRGDWTIAGHGPRVTMRWDDAPRSGVARGPGGAPDPTLAQIAAKRRVEAAVAAVGPGLSDMLWRVACAGEGLTEAEAALGWPKRAGKLVLGLALDRLGDFYRL